ncbi:hypothetical protein KI387_019818, partial [Taxus chinensis]
PEAIERLHNRISMLQVVSELNTIKQDDEDDDEDETFGIPKQIVVYKAEDLSDYQTLVGLNFPVIAKPLVADGSVKSHKMSLVFNPEGLHKLKPPLVLQEFVNHGGVIFKVYVVGDYVKCVKRKSLPDVSEEKLGSSEGSLAFCHVSNVTHDHQNERYYEVMHLEDAELPPARFIANIAGSLRKALGLHLFNFDVIRDTRIGNHYLVIDINYFPGYAKMPAYESVLTDFFWNIFHEGKRIEGRGIEYDNLVHAPNDGGKDEDDVEQSTGARLSSAVIIEEEKDCDKIPEIGAGLQETLAMAKVISLVSLDKARGISRGSLDKEGDMLVETFAKSADTLGETLAKADKSTRQTLVKADNSSRETLSKAEDTSNINDKEGFTKVNTDSNISSQ